MLGYRTIYPSSAVHASCIVRLEDDPRDPFRELILAAVGNKLDVYEVCVRSEISKSQAGTSTDASSTVSLMPLGQSFLVGTSVLKLAPLRHQMFAVWTRELELLLVRYQANLSPLSSISPDAQSSEGDSAVDRLLVPAWQHWCVCARFPLGLRALAAAPDAQPHPSPHLLCDASGTVIVACLFEGCSFGVHIALPLHEGSTAYFTSRWRSDAPNGVPALTVGDLHPTRPLSSIDHLLTLSHGGMGGAEPTEAWQARRAEVARRWRDEAGDYADEDLFLDYSVEQLAERKRAVFTGAVAREERYFNGELHAPVRDASAKGKAVVRDGAWAPAPEVRCAPAGFHHSAILLPPARVAGGRDAARPTLWMLSFRPRGGDSAPMWKVTELAAPLHVTKEWLTPAAKHPLLWGPMEAYLSLSIPVLTDASVEAAPGEGRAASRCPPFWYRTVVLCKVAEVHHIICVRLPELMGEVAVGEGAGGAALCQLAAEPVAAVDGLTLMPLTGGADGGYGPPVAWLLLADGTLTCVPHEVLMGKWPQPNFDDCMAGRWPRQTVEGLPPSFHPLRMDPMLMTDPLHQQLKVTHRYALLLDDVCHAFVVDLLELRAVGGLGGPGALSSACGGPVGTNDLFVAHANGLVRRLTPSIPLQCRDRYALSSTLAPASLCVAGHPRLVAPLPLAWVRDTAAPPAAPMPRAVVCAAVEGDVAAASPAAGALGLAHCGGALLWCTPRAVHCQALPCASAGLSSVPLPWTITHAAACSADEGVGEGVGFVVAILDDGRVAVVTNYTAPPAAACHPPGQPPYRVAYVSPEACEAARVGVTFVGVAYAGPTADGEGPVLVVPVGSWDGCVWLLTLRWAGPTDTWTMTGAEAADELANPDPLDAAAVPVQLVAAPPVDARAVWVVRTTSGAVSVLVADRAGRGAWQRLRYTTQPRESGSADEARTVRASLLGGLSIEDRLGSSVASLGVGRSGVLLMHPEPVCSLLFFSLPTPSAAGGDAHGPVDPNEEEGEPTPLVEEEVRVHVEDACAPAAPAHEGARDWLGGCLTAHLGAGATVTTFTVHLAQQGGVRSVGVPASVLQYVRRERLVPSTAVPPTHPRREDWELAVRAAPVYMVSAARQCLTDPRELLVRAVYAASVDAVLAVVDREGDASLLIALEGTRLTPMDSLVAQRQAVRCAAGVPFVASLPATGRTPADLVVLGTAPVGSEARASVLLVSPKPLCVRAALALGSAGSRECVTDVAVQRHRGRSGWGTAGGPCTSAGRASHSLRQEEVLVAACCGRTVHVLLLTGLTLHPLATFTADMACLTLSLCYPFVVVGCGTGGNLVLQLRNRGVVREAIPHTEESSSVSGEWSDTSDDSMATSDSYEEGHDGSRAGSSPHRPSCDDDHGDSRSGAVGPQAKDHGTYPQRSMELFEVGLELAMYGATVNQTSYRDTHVIRTDMDASVVFSRVDFGDSSAGKPPVEMCLVGTDESPGFTEIFHCVRLPSPATAVECAVGERAGDGHAAVWRRQRRHIRWAESCTTLRTTSARTDGGGPTRVLLPCQDGSLHSIQELPWAFGHPLQLLEQCYMDRYGEYLAPARLWPSPVALPAVPQTPAASLPGVANAHPLYAQLTYHSIPFRASQAVHNSHRVLQRQGMISIDVLEEVFRLAALDVVVDGAASGADGQGEPPRGPAANAVVAELARMLGEEYGSDLSISDCQEVCSAW